MVKPIFKRKGKMKFLTKLIILVSVFAVISIGFMYKLQSDTAASSTILITIDNKDDSTLDMTKTGSTSTSAVSDTPPKSEVLAVVDDTTNNQKIKTNRNKIMEQCSTKTADIDLIKSEYFKLPNTIPKQSPKPSIKRCKNVVLDFGANVGDTAGHLIDAGMPNCDSAAQTNNFIRLMLGERQVEVGRWNMVTKFLKQMMDANKLFPEDYCYYGIEGNPVFTERLQGIEDFIASIEPRPLAHASFLTESVGAGEYGMTKLFLDTVNTKENFWGSSIMANHQDVKKSTGENEAPPSHDVMGYTITKLMEMTLIGFQNDATEEEKKGAHLLLKVDIEGGEYVLTQEVVQSKALCKFVEMGNTVDVVIETHSQRVTGPNPLARKFGGWRKELEECGVTFRGLQAWWA